MLNFLSSHVENSENLSNLVSNYSLPITDKQQHPLAIHQEGVVVLGAGSCNHPLRLIAINYSLNNR